MARFYTNENFPIPIANQLRKFGHDVLTIQETGKANQALSDREVLVFAPFSKANFSNHEPETLHRTAHGPA